MNFNIDSKDILKNLKFLSSDKSKTFRNWVFWLIVIIFIINPIIEHVL